MGRRDRGAGVERKKSKFSFFKIIFTLLFLALTILWTLYTVSFIGIFKDGWEAALKLPYMEQINAWIEQYITASAQNSQLKYAGVVLFVVGIDAILVYTTIFYPIQLIPFIGKLLKWLTGIIPTLSAIAIIIGAVIIWAI